MNYKTVRDRYSTIAAIRHIKSACDHLGVGILEYAECHLHLKVIKNADHSGRFGIALHSILNGKDYQNERGPDFGRSEIKLYDGDSDTHITIRGLSPTDCAGTFIQSSQYNALCYMIFVKGQKCAGGDDMRIVDAFSLDLSNHNGMFSALEHAWNECKAAALKASDQLSQPTQTLTQQIHPLFADAAGPFYVAQASVKRRRRPIIGALVLDRKSKKDNQYPLCRFRKSHIEAVRNDELWRNQMAIADILDGD